MIKPLPNGTLTNGLHQAMNEGPTTEASVPRVTSEEELDALRERSPSPVLLQFSSHTCTRCGPFAEAVLAEGRDYEFEYRMVVVTDAPELVEAFEVAKLPAFVLLSPTGEGSREATQAASVEAMQAAVRTMCAPRFRLDEEF